MGAEEKKDQEEGREGKEREEAGRAGKGYDSCDWTWDEMSSR